MKYKEIPIEDIITTGNVRIEEDAEISGMVSSIEKHGVLQPVVVRHVLGSGGAIKYELICGHRRLRAVQMIGQETIPAMISDEEISKSEKTILQIVENTQKKEMSALEYVETFNALRKQDPSMSYAKIGRLIGRTAGWVNNQYTAAKVAGHLISRGYSPKEVKKLTAGRIISRAQKDGIGPKGPGAVRDITVMIGNSTTLTVRCRDKEVVSRLLEAIDVIRDDIRREWQKERAVDE